MALPKPNAIDYKLVENLSLRKWSTLASLAVLSWEYILTSRDEFCYIWRRPTTGVKITYIFSHYFAIIVQSINFYLVSGPLWSVDIPDTVCKQWFMFLIIAACCLMAALDLILMLRIYALYLKDIRITVLLVLLFCAQIAAEAVLSPRTILDVPFDCICDTTETHPNIIYFCISVWVTHLPLGILTVAKRNLAQLGVPVARVVTRDGIWIVILVCCSSAGVLSLSTRARDGSRNHNSAILSHHTLLLYQSSVKSTRCFWLADLIIIYHLLPDDYEHAEIASHNIRSEKYGQRLERY
ncbi:hypothetical protein BDZ97DRAFT_2078450 [Flammula alnicola]|nr:hypothetical protein BDZ97DRAFT_2078450 [Flammula alnicola]